MNKTITEKRQFPRVTAILPIRITPEFLGETVDLSETGLRFVLQRPLLLSKAQAKIELSPEESIDTEFKVIWNKHLVTEGKFTYGVCFIRIKEKDKAILRQILYQSKIIDEKFIILTNNFKEFLQSIKNKFDKFDIDNMEEQKILFIEQEKEELFNKLDSYFYRVWRIVENFDMQSYKIYTRYFRNSIRSLLLEPIEINRYIYRQPLGYPGDFVMMNYIYDYHNDRYLGESSYQKILNIYTCNIPISCSNIARKHFFKNKILKVSKNKSIASILSIGCGPVRELIELLMEGRITKQLLFDCFDFEKKALAYIKSEIDKINSEDKHCLSIRYLNNNFLDIIKNEHLKKQFKKYDFIYASGVFDYLKDRFATRLLEALYQLLNKDGILIICNANKENSFHRAYYEMIGDWVFFHRTRDDIMKWLKNITDAQEIKFEELANGNNYLYLSIKKS